MTNEPAKLLPLPEEWTRGMAVVAHPDDIEYGLASAIARWTAQGKEVVYLLATKGEAGIDAMRPDEVGPLREDEERRSAARVGVKTVEFLNYADGVIEYGLPLRRDFARAFRRHRPEVVFTINHGLTFGGVNLNMADHRNVALAVLDAARDAGNRWIFPELIKEGWEPWNEIKMVAIAGTPTPTHGTDITGYLEKGIESLQEHKVYIENLPFKFDPEEFLTWMAAGAGDRFGTDYAVNFQVVNI